jgi:hypothetical protein
MRVVNFGPIHELHIVLYNVNSFSLLPTREKMVLLQKEKENQNKIDDLNKLIKFSSLELMSDKHRQKNVF